VKVQAGYTYAPEANKQYAKSCKNCCPEKIPRYLGTAGMLDSGGGETKFDG